MCTREGKTLLQLMCVVRLSSTRLEKNQHEKILTTLEKVVNLLDKSFHIAIDSDILQR